MIGQYSENVILFGRKRQLAAALNEQTFVSSGC